MNCNIGSELGYQDTFLFLLKTYIYIYMCVCVCVVFNTFRTRGVYILRGLSSHQSGRPLNLNIPRSGVF